MATPTLTPPPRTTRGSRTSVAQPPPGKLLPQAPPRQDRRYPQALRRALLASALFHLLILALSPLFIRVGLPPGQTGTPYEPIRMPALRMVDLGTGEEVREPAPAETDEMIPVLSPDAQQEVVPTSNAEVPPSAAEGEPARDEAAAPARARDALRPGYSDPRLYVTPRELPPPPEPSQHERYMARLEARLDAYNDSIGAEAERARKATDWTYTDEDGNRWGVSPGKIHLGGVTLPLPVQLGGSGERQREADEEARQRDAIQRDEQTRSQREVMEERIEATRERKDAEREQARQDEAEEEEAEPPR